MMDLQGRMLPLPDAFAGEASELRLTPEFVERGLRQVDNTAARNKPNWQQK